jgi:protein-L-isoaspartate(D-aspartate) O-methyltransferase
MGRVNLPRKPGRPDGALPRTLGIAVAASAPACESTATTAPPDPIVAQPPSPREPRDGSRAPTPRDTRGAEVSDGFASARVEMVRTQLEGRDIRDPRVLEAMRTVPRHAFVPESSVDLAYTDRPLPIGYGVTISQPYIVALMIELAAIDPGDRVLDIGTGSGYQAAVLASMGAEVRGIEIIEPLAEEAAARLQTLGFDAQIKAGDGYRGWPEHAPFDAIIVAAAAPRIPEPLRKQLAVGGRLVIPVGEQRSVQELVVITRTRSGYEQRKVLPVAFVPMTGEIRD